MDSLGRTVRTRLVRTRARDSFCVQILMATMMMMTTTMMMMIMMIRNYAVKAFLNKDCNMLFSESRNFDHVAVEDVLGSGQLAHRVIGV